MVPMIIQLRRHPNLVPRHTRRPYPLADLLFIAVVQCGVDVAIAMLQCILDSFMRVVIFGLPSPEPNGWDRGAIIQLEGVGGKLWNRHGENVWLRRLWKSTVIAV